MAMDFWASLEHKIKYKTDKEVTKKMCRELINAAKILNKMDLQMATKASKLEKVIIACMATKVNNEVVLSRAISASEITSTEVKITNKLHFKE